MSDQDRHSEAERPLLIEDEDEIARVESANALRQIDQALDIIDTVARDKRPFKLRASTVLGLHRTALEKLSHYAGVFRPGVVKIGKSKHTPPDAHLVAGLVEEMCDYVNDNWVKFSALELCAYVMWRLNWIHPFEDGNGRTSRAVAYVVLCCRIGDRLLGNKTIMEQIAGNKAPYYEALEAADKRWKDGGKVDVSEMVGLLEAYLAVQLKSVFDQARTADSGSDEDRKFH